MDQWTTNRVVTGVAYGCMCYALEAVLQMMTNKHDHVGIPSVSLVIEKLAKKPKLRVVRRGIRHAPHYTTAVRVRAATSQDDTNGSGEMHTDT